MPKFKVGDLVTGVENSPYRYTNEHAVMRIIRRPGDVRFCVEVISHTKHPECIGHSYGDVSDKHFILYTPKPKQLINK